MSQVFFNEKCERFGNMMRIYTRESQGCFVLCDVTRISSIESAKKWLTIFRSHIDHNCPCYLLVNKMDLINELDESTQEKINIIGEDFDKVFMISSKDATTYDITGKINPDIKLKDVIDNMLYDLIKLPNHMLSKQNNEHEATKKVPIAELFDDIDSIVSRTSNKPPKLGKPEEQIISNRSNMYYVSERIRIKLTLPAFITAPDMIAKCCFNIVDYIIDKINDVVEVSGIMTYIYHCSDHNLDDANLIGTIIDELRSKGYLCNHNKDNNRIIITWNK